VHRILGPGLLESIYDQALCVELQRRNLLVNRQRELPIVYKGVSLEGGFRIDIMVEEMVIIEVKAVEKLLPVHEAQLLTYLKLANLKLGLLMNFNSTVVSNSIRRVVNQL
jgi:GxxExxY protein